MKVDIRFPIIVMALACAGLAWAFNYQPERALSGTNLAVALNGTDTWVENVDAGICGTFSMTQSTVAGTATMVVCDHASYVYNASTLDGGYLRSIPVAAGERFRMGMLKPNDGVVLVCGATTGTRCDFFHTF